jgi:predicted adenylyl cyclase CyaB
MALKNIEFKAKVNNMDELEEKLLKLSPKFIGTDRQTDTYYRAKRGRLKLREGNIENALIHYERPNTADAKLSEILLYKHTPDKDLKAILEAQFGILTIVKKERKIYFIDNIKFHFDRVEKLGTFIETEAIDENGSMSIQQLQAQCDYYFDFFGLKDEQLMSESYSDMLSV